MNDKKPATVEWQGDGGGGYKILGGRICGTCWYTELE